MGPTRLASKASQFSLLLAVTSRYFVLAWVTPFTRVLATEGHKVSNYRKSGILPAAEEVVRAGVLSHAPGSERVNTFHLSHLSWIGQLLSVFFWLLGWFCLLCCCFPFVH